MPQPLTTYKSLVTQIARELSELEVLVKRRTAEAYWRVGKFIHEHLLANEKRAEYGATLYERLAKDVDRDVSTLQRSVQFFRAYPIPAERRELTWEHYKSLITIKDDAERKKLEAKVIRQDWNSTKLREYLNVKRELDAPTDTNKPVAQLTFTRGKLHTYQLVAANKPLVNKSPLVLDLGFRLEYFVTKSAAGLKESDTVELAFNENALTGVKKSTAGKDELFTYQASVDKIIDGDTLITSFDFRLDASLSQKLRLRGIDCPEMDTNEGKKAKRFVESQLKGCEFVIVKTYKDRSDKYDRYLADVFYQAGEPDPNVVAQQGTYLNQELLNKHLAKKYS